MSQESLQKKRNILYRRKQRIRGLVFGTPEKPRLSVYKSLKHLYLQIIDDTSGKVLLAIHDSSISKDKKIKNIELAHKAGKELAVQALEKGITNIVFDRGGNKYHGRVKAVADGAREGGLKF